MVIGPFDSIPVQRRRVRARAPAEGSGVVPSRSTSSYSSSPSCTTTRPPAPTNRRDGWVGSARSVGPPSVTVPRSTTAKAHSASEVVARSGSGSQARRRWSRLRLSSSVVTVTRGEPARRPRVVTTSVSTSPTRRPSTTASGRRSVARTSTSARSGPGSTMRTVTESGRSTTGVAVERRRRPVVGVAGVAVVDEPAQPCRGVGSGGVGEAEGAVLRLHREGDHAVADDHPAVGRRRRRHRSDVGREWRRPPPGPPEAGDLDPGQHPLARGRGDRDDRRALGIGLGEGDHVGLQRAGVTAVAASTGRARW